MRRRGQEDVAGHQLGGYTILRHLASGSMSELYLARHEAAGGFEKNLVIKVLQDRYSCHPQVVRMFLNEARLAAELDHPNIVRIYDLAEVEGKTLIAMEYIHGETLTDIIQRCAAGGNSVPLEHALAIVSQVAAGLDYAHGRHEPSGWPRRIVHGDISPSNIMVGYQGQTKIIDFGVACVQDEVHKRLGMDPDEASQGTPERFVKDAVDHRSDILSLGIILYDIALAHHIWRGSAEEAKERIVSEQIRPLASIRSDYPRELELIVRRALAKSPEDRYQSAEEMRRDLTELVATIGAGSSADRVALYLRELFPTVASASEDGFAAPGVQGQSGSSPSATPSASDDTDRENRCSSDAMVPATAAEPIRSRMSRPTAVQETPSHAILPATRKPRGLSHAKLVLISTTVTLALVSAAVLVARSRWSETETVTAAQPSGAHTSESLHQPVAPKLQPSFLGSKQSLPEFMNASSEPTPSPRAAASAPHRAGTFAGNRALIRRQRLQTGVSKPSSRSSFAHENSDRAALVPEAPPISPEGSASAPPTVLPIVAQPLTEPLDRAARPTPPPPLPGLVDSKAVTAVVLGHGSEVEACLDRARMERAELHGRITIRATIDPSGRVLAVSPIARMEGGDRLQRCVVAAFQHWTLPRPTGGVNGTVSYSFLFD